MDDVAISGLLNGETVTINSNAKLTLNSDSRWSAQAAVIGNITLNAATGGECHVDGTTVWQVPFNTGTGNVPARGTVISRGGASGEMLGVFSALGVAETAPGAAMPASGFIKLRSKTGDFTAGALTGISASATGAGQRSWLHIVGTEATTINVPRLGTLRMTGDWFELGTTTGVRNQTVQLPVADILPAVQIETAAGSGVYEWYPNAGSQFTAANYPASTTDPRAKVVIITSAGLLRIGSSSTPADCAFLPPVGCKIRIPNLIVSSSTSANYALNTLNATLATRWDLTTTSSGVILLDKVIGSGFFVSAAQPYQCEITDCAFFEQINISECATPVVLQRNCIGQSAANLQNALVLTSCFADGVVEDNVWTRASLAASGAYVNSISNISGFTFSRNKTLSCTLRGNATTGTWTITNALNCDFVDEILIGGRMVFVTGVNCNVTNTKYADSGAGTTGTGNPHYAIDLSSKCNNVVVSGFSNYNNLTNAHPYNGIVTLNACDNIKIRNIGTALSNYNMGSANASGVVANLGGNSSNLKLQRCYTVNARVGAATTTNSDTVAVLESVWADGADVQAIATLNAIAKGCRWSNTTTGQTAVYGTHWMDCFTSTTAGRIVVVCNEKTTLEPSASSYTVDAGSPKFTSVGTVSMPAVSDRITWETPHRILGHTSFANIAPTITGTNTGNFTLEYDLDKGAGFSAVWKTLNAANLSSETGISSSLGFRMRIRATTATANASNALAYIRVDTVTDSVSQQAQYPLDLATLQITGLESGSEVRIFRNSDDIELGGTESSGASLSVQYEHTGIDINARVVVHALGFVYESFNVLLPASGLPFPVKQRPDRNYQNL
jgi:hypothetical protein